MDGLLWADFSTNCIPSSTNSFTVSSLIGTSNVLSGTAGDDLWTTCDDTCGITKPLCMECLSIVAAFDFDGALLVLITSLALGSTLLLLFCIFKISTDLTDIGSTSTTSTSTSSWAGTTTA